MTTKEACRLMLKRLQQVDRYFHVYGKDALLREMPAANDYVLLREAARVTLEFDPTADDRVDAGGCTCIELREISGRPRGRRLSVDCPIHERNGKVRG